jgi:ADP-ribose pyrophosphatase YjhB (NUDIX family)
MNQTFIHTFVSVDCVVLGFDKEQLNVLLVRRDNNPEETCALKLPGSLIYDEEDVDDAATRVLFELTGIKKVPLRQFRCFASPHRASKPEDKKWLNQAYQPNINRLITVAYIALCKIDRKHHNISKYSSEWCPLSEVAEMPFDHNQILEASLTEIQKWVELEPSVIFNLLAQKFTISQLHRLYESIYAKKIDIRNFHKKVATMPQVVPLDEREEGVAHRAARYYKFDKKGYTKLKNNL